MKRLALFFMALAMFTGSYASNEHLVVMQSDGPTDGPVTRINPCTDVPLKVTYTIPSGFNAVARFEWYVNNNLFATTTSTSGGYGGVTYRLNAPIANVVCKVIYTNGGSESAPAPTNTVELDSKYNPYTLHGQNNVDLGVHTVTYTLDNPQVGPDFYVLNTGSYTVAWEYPAGWTLVSNNGLSATFTTDDYSGGTVKAFFNITYCGFRDGGGPGYQVNVTRNYPAVSFTNPYTETVCYNNPSVTIAMNPQPAAISYTYTIYPSYGSDISGAILVGSGTQTLTTTDASATINFITSSDLLINLGVKANYGNGVSGPERIKLIGFYGELQWPSQDINISYNPISTGPCYGSLSVEVPWLSGAYYYYYLDGWMVDQGYSNTTGFEYHGESTLSVYAWTNCANTGYIYKDLNGLCGWGAKAADASVSVYPNPAVSEVTLNIKEVAMGKTTTAAAGKALKEIREVKMLDKFGSVKKIVKFPTGTKTAKLTLGSLPPDMYVLEISDGVNKITKRISKTR